MAGDKSTFADNVKAVSQATGDIAGKVIPMITGKGTPSQAPTGGGGGYTPSRGFEWPSWATPTLIGIGAVVGGIILYKKLKKK